MEILELINKKMLLMVEPDIHIVIDEISIEHEIDVKELLYIYDNQSGSL